MVKYQEFHSQPHNVRCKFYMDKPRTATRAVVFCTGFAGHKDGSAAERFAEKVLSKYKDVMIVVFDWPSHGDDVKRRLILEDCDTYLTIVLEGLREEFGIREFYCNATSFGAYLVLKYIHEHGHPFVKTALRCPAVDMKDVFLRLLPEDAAAQLAKGRDVEAGFDRKVRVGQDFVDSLAAHDLRDYDYLDYADDILILQGTKDEVVPFESARSFAEAQLFEFIPIEGADHRFQNPLHMDLANKYILEFMGM